MLAKLVKITVFSILIFWLRSFYVIPLFFLGHWLLIKLIELFNNLDYIQGSDLIFLWEYPKAPNTIVTSIVIEQIPLKNFKTIFLERIIRKLRRMRTHVVEFLGESFWKELEENECLSQIKEICHLQNDQEVAKFKADLFAKHLPKNRPLWEVYYQESYDKTKTIIILKYHHCLGDGGSLLNLLSSLIDDRQLIKDYNSALPKISIFKKLFLIICSPYFMVKNLPNMDKNLNNALLGYGGMSSGVFKFAESKEYSVKELKSCLRSFENATLNDLSWTILTRAIKKFLSENKRDPKENEKFLDNKKLGLIGLMGASSRISLEEGEMGNQSLGVILTVNMEIDQFDKQLETVRTLTAKGKDKVGLHSASYIGTFMINNFMDRNSMIKFGEKAFEKVGFVFSNIIGPKNKVYIDGKEILDFHPVLPKGILGFSLISFSYNNRMRYCINTDQSYNFPCEKIIGLMENELDEFIKIYS